MFYKCTSEPPCDFFQWADAVPGPNCKCNKPSTKKTSSKEGDNLGREFFACSSRPGCDYFEWADGGASSSGGGFRTNSNPATSRVSGVQYMCECGQPAVNKTVQKEGPNKGYQLFEVRLHFVIGIFQAAHFIVAPSRKGNPASFSFGMASKVVTAMHLPQHLAWLVTIAGRYSFILF